MTSTPHTPVRHAREGAGGREVRSCDSDAQPDLELYMLHASNISKSFFGNTVLKNFTLDVADGEVHALLGHNGSGKSTFVKILCGFHEPDDDGGEIIVGDRQLRFGDPHSSAEAGVRVVHQGLGLIGSLTVLENLRLGVGKYDTSAVGKIRWNRERNQARDDLGVLGLSIEPDARFDTLTAVQQTQVAIARAVQARGSVRCLILDEPTAALPESEVERLHGVIAPLRALGVSVLYVTHRLGEVHAIASHVSVLRDGRLMAQGRAEDYSRTDLLNLIANTSALPAGQTAPSDDSRLEHDRAPSRKAASGARTRIETLAAPASKGGSPQTKGGRDAGRALLELKEIFTSTLAGLSLTVRRGEILGIVSLVGAGVEEIPRVLRGDIQPVRGSIALNGAELDCDGPHGWQSRGVLVVPSGLEEKSCGSMSVRENLTLGLLGRFWRHLRLDHRQERQFARGVVERYGVRCGGTEVQARTLSGGNRQKLVVARAMERRPDVLILDEPTQGVDVGGKAEILALLHQAAAAGMAVVLCSSDLEEIAEACSRAIVLHRGAVRAELVGVSITPERIIRECHT